MKKNLLKIVSILVLGFIGVSVSAQGTWKATGTEPLMSPGTAITTGIANLTVMHSDANVLAVVGKPDALATTVSYNTVTYDNLAFIQGATNGMYFAFRPTITGTLDVSVKMGSAKATYVLELTDICPNNADLAVLTVTPGNILVTDISAFATYYTTPLVYDTYNASSASWNGTPIQSTGANVYMVMSFPVTANKTYLVAVAGSKLMLRGINLTLGTGVSESTANAIGISPNPASGNVNINVDEATEIAIYNTSGSLLIQQLVNPADNNVDISALAPGVYFVKDINGTSTQKLIVK